MKKRNFLSLFIVGVMLFGMVACGTSSSSLAQSGTGEESKRVESGGAGGDYKIQVILKTLASEYWGYVQAGATSAGKELGVQVDVVGAASETAFDEQINIIETSLGSGSYDAFVIAPLQADMVSTKIADAAVPIIAVDTKIASDKVLTFVGTGNEEAAKKGGVAAVEAAKEAGWEEINAIAISGVQGDVTAMARLSGYEAGVVEAGGNFLKDEIQYGDAVADKAVTSMEAIIQNHPEGVAIIVCHNDDTAMAAARAAKGSPAFENTIFVGFDGIISACDAILAGEETMSVAQDAYGMGYKAVEAALNALNGETLEPFIDSGASIITAENAQEQKDKLNGYLGK